MDDNLVTFSETSLCLGLLLFSLKIGQTAIRWYLVAPCCPLLWVDLREGCVLQRLATSHGNLDMPLIPGNTVIDIYMKLMKMQALTEFTRKIFAMLIECTECQDFCQFVRIWSPHPLIRKRGLIPLPFGSRGETHSLAGEGGWGTQFRRRDRHSGTLRILQSLYGSPQGYRLINLRVCSG